MEFSVNFTLIVQMLHFFVAYLILKRFFFRTAINFLVEKDNQKSVLTSQIQDQELELSKRREDISSLWHGARDRFLKELTLFSKNKLLSTKAPEIKVETMPESEKFSEEQSLKNCIIDKVKNG